MCHRRIRLSSAHLDVLVSAYTHTQLAQVLRDACRRPLPCGQSCEDWPRMWFDDDHGLRVGPTNGLAFVGSWIRSSHRQRDSRIPPSG